MADNKSNTAPQDASRVNVHEDYEAAYWTKKWGVTKAAVKKAGTSVTAVAKELGK